MRITIFIVFLVWLVLTILYILKPKWFRKYRMVFHRLGWFNTWSLFISNKSTQEISVVLTYRDIEGDVIGEWKSLTYKWHPFRFLFNMELRMYSLIMNCVKQLIKEHQVGKKNLKGDEWFKYMFQIICSYRPNKRAIARQVRLAYSDINQESEELIAETDFISLQ